MRPELGESYVVEGGLEAAKAVLSRILLGGNNWRKRNFKSEGGNLNKHRSCSMPVESFQNHVATDGSLFGVSGSWIACGWSIVQLDGADAWDVRHIGR